MELICGICRYEGQKAAQWEETSLQEADVLTVAGARFRVRPELVQTRDGLAGSVTFTLERGRLPQGGAYVRLELPFGGEDYLFMPAACYNGNRFRVSKQPYAPKFREEDRPSPDMETVISDVPRLNLDGTGTIHLRSGDLATQCFGLLQGERGLLLYSTHRTQAGYTGYRFDGSGGRGCMSVSAPCVRERRYSMLNPSDVSTDRGFGWEEGDSVTIPLRLYVFEARDIPALYRVFFATRGCMGEDAEQAQVLPFSAAFRIEEEKYQKSQWNEAQGYWKVAAGQEDWIYGDWQAGWVGGGINAFPLAFDGDALSRERSRRTMDAVFSALQAETGFIWPNMFRGQMMGDNDHYPKQTGYTLLRKNADVLLFACKTILLWQRREGRAPDNWIQGVTRLADAFVRLFEKYGQLGQFVDIEQETILAGGTASAASAVGGLTLVYRITGRRAYRDTALALARYYDEHNIQKGLLNGGPGEALQCPDSESAFGLLEGLTALYGVTGDPEVLRMAEDCACQAASWCVTCNFAFPERTEFGRLRMRAAGSVFANVQNKHSAPGLCTLSPVGLLRLFLATGREEYLTLCQQIAHNIMQYMSTARRPIRGWDEVLPPGYMCERVNTSDWEGDACVGGVYAGSCWCEVSALLTCVEIPGLLICRDTGRLTVFDHVEASLSDGACTVRNPTAYDCTVRVLATEEKKGRVLDECALLNCRTIPVPSGQSVIFSI